MAIVAIKTLYSVRVCGNVAIKEEMPQLVQNKMPQLVAASAGCLTGK